MITPILESLEPPFAELLELIQDIRCDPVMNFLPDFVDNVKIGSLHFSIKIEAHSEKQLGLFPFVLFSDRRSDIHDKNTDRISAAAVEQQIAGVIV